MARWAHSLTAFSFGPEVTEVLEFGGCLESYTLFDGDEMLPKAADTTLMQFSKCKHNTAFDFECITYLYFAPPTTLYTFSVMHYLFRTDGEFRGVSMEAAFCIR